MVTATLDTKGNAIPEKLSLADLREVLFNGEAPRKTDLDVLVEMAKDKRGLVKKVLQNKELIKRAGNPDQLLYELDSLHTRYREEIKTLEGAKSFEAKVEKQSWGRWALEKVKSVVLFPVRHPVYTLLILAAALAGVGFYYGNLGKWLLATIPNYAGKAAEVLKQGVKIASEKLGLAAETAYGGKVPLSTSPVPALPYESPAVPGLFTSPTSPPIVTPPMPPPGVGDFGVTPL